MRSPNCDLRNLLDNLHARQSIHENAERAAHWGEGDVSPSDKSAGSRFRLSNIAEMFSMHEHLINQRANPPCCCWGLAVASTARCPNKRAVWANNTRARMSPSVSKQRHTDEGSDPHLSNDSENPLRLTQGRTPPELLRLEVIIDPWRVFPFNPGSKPPWCCITSPVEGSSLLTPGFSSNCSKDHTRAQFHNKCCVKGLDETSVSFVSFLQKETAHNSATLLSLLLVILLVMIITPQKCNHHFCYDLRLLLLHNEAVGKPDRCRGHVSDPVVRPWVKVTPEYSLNCKEGETESLFLAFVTSCKISWGPGVL